MNEDIPEPIPDSPPETAVALQAKVDQLERQNADYKALIADYQTSARRLREDSDKQRKYAIEPLVKDLIGSIDNLDRAADAARTAGEKGSLVQGVTATLSLFLDALKRHGVTVVPVQPGSPFDAHQHQAVMETPTNDYKPGSVVQVLQQGFLLHDRVLRPAGVIVASEPPAGS